MGMPGDVDQLTYVAVDMNLLAVRADDKVLAVLLRDALCTLLERFCSVLGPPFAETAFMSVPMFDVNKPIESETYHARHIGCRCCRTRE